MSFDRQIDQVCPHLVVEELLTIGTDRRTVTPVRPIASFDSVRVRLNGDLNVPITGVDTPAKSGGTREGPFPILSTANRIELSVHSGARQTAILPVSTRLSADRIADLLNAQLRGVTFSTEKNSIRFKTDLAGDDASLYIFKESTLAKTLGISTDREFRGKRVAPAWTLIQDPNTLLDRPKRLIVFDDPLRGFNDFVEVSYTTVLQECRRCGGVGVEYDWRYGSDGNLAEVRDEALLIQELQKAVFTQKGSNIFHPWYGTYLLDNVGKKNNLVGLLQSTITSDIQQMFTRWQTIKTQQEKDVGQFVSDSEFPFRLLGVQVEQSISDPTVIFVNITVQNRSTQPIQISRGLRLPASLSFSDAGQGSIRQSTQGLTPVG